MEARCPRFGKLIGGCRFEARYDEPAMFGLFNSPWKSGSIKVDGEKFSIEDISDKKKYVRDICVRCGKVVDRTKP